MVKNSNMNAKNFLNIYFLYILSSVVNALEFNEVTNDVFPASEDEGVIAAFGHFNSDEYTDIVTLQKSGHKLQILKGNENEPYSSDSLNCSFSNIINNVIPGDYNGDTILDLLISLSENSATNSDFRINIIWGKNGTFDCNLEYLFNVTKQVFVVDFNNDMLPDIVGEVQGNRYVWLSSTEKKFTEKNLNNEIDQELKDIHSSGLVDLNHDLIPDMLVMGKKYIEAWFNNGVRYHRHNSKNMHYPSDAKWVWQPTFIDMNLNGQMEILLPVCLDNKCVKSEILIWNANLSQWETLLNNFRHNMVPWGFNIQRLSILEQAALIPTIRAGDVDMDGYPDFIMVLQSKKSFLNFRAVILKNIPCNDGCLTGRTLEILWDVPGLSEISNVQIATFFDLYEDGVLDILISTKKKDEWKVHTLKNAEVFDSCFLKVLVLNGLCSHNCTHGVNQPGPMVQYNMTKENGLPVVSTAVQLSQSAHFSLQLPYSLFGLGPTPNFIDILSVSVLSKFNRTMHKREWTQIIPNSQIVVIPYPPTNEKMWVKKLFVTPSHLVLLTCISLVGTCIFISLLVALLHWKERREDKIEKMQEAYRFHFDAM